MGNFVSFIFITRQLYKGKKFEDLVAAIELTSVHIDLAIVTIINLDLDGMKTLF